MRRRRFFKTLAVTPAASAVLGQQVPNQNSAPRPTSPVPPPADALQPPAPLNRTPPAAAEYPTIEVSVHDDVGDMQPKFFTQAQFATLRKLSGVLMPRQGDLPGALEAHAPEFLDFLISRSPRERQDIYRTGLDGLAAQARKRFNKDFDSLDEEAIATLLAPLKQAWTYDPPAEPIARFLRAAKQDVRTATVNSREYASAATGGGGRRGAGLGLYWYPLD